MSSDAATDAELLRESASANRDAFQQFVTRHQARLYRFCWTLTRDREAAEDALQETFLTAWRKANTFRGEGAALSWLFTIARRKVLRKLENRTRLEKAADVEALAEKAGWGRNQEPVAWAGALDDRILLEEVFERLHPADREVLLLRELEGYSAEEAAALTGVGVAAFKSRLHRARLRALAALKEGLEHAG